MASFMLGSLHSPSHGTYDVTVRSQPPRQPEGSQVIWLPLRLWQEHSARDHRGRSGRWRTWAVHAHGKYDKPRERLPFSPQLDYLSSERSHSRRPPPPLHTAQLYAQWHRTQHQARRCRRHPPPRDSMVTLISEPNDERMRVKPGRRRKTVGHVQRLFAAAEPPCKTARWFRNKGPVLTLPTDDGDGSIVARLTERTARRCRTQPPKPLADSRR